MYLLSTSLVCKLPYAWICPLSIFPAVWWNLWLSVFFSRYYWGVKTRVLCKWGHTEPCPFLILISVPHRWIPLKVFYLSPFRSKADETDKQNKPRCLPHWCDTYVWIPVEMTPSKPRAFPFNPTSPLTAGDKSFTVVLLAESKNHLSFHV